MSRHRRHPLVKKWEHLEGGGGWIGDPVKIQQLIANKTWLSVSMAK
jgi:hypothetical protein